MAGRSEGGGLETRGVDRVGVRRRLLKTWTDALVGGRLRPELALPGRARLAAVEHISALACIGLAQDTLEVRFDQLVGPHDSESSAAHAKLLEDKLKARLIELHGDWPDGAQRIGAQEPESMSRDSLALAATWGEQLGLVEAHGDRVRFQHSIMQAYLGSRFMDVVLDEPRFLRGALCLKPGPSREFLISLAFRSRDGESTAEPGVRPSVGELMDAANGRWDEKSLDLYMTALEVDSACGRARYPQIAAALKGRWQLVESQDEQGLVAAKLNLVHRFGDVLRQTAKDSRNALASQGLEQAYRDLFDVACQERSYEVRLATAEEIGSGGDTAFHALRAEFEPTPREVATPERTSDEREKKEMERRRLIMCAWLIPLLLGSVSNETDRQEVKSFLVEWLAWIRSDPPDDGKCPLPLTVEIAISQGFKAAANRRARHFATSPEARVILAEQAEELLGQCRFWYSQLTLIQALTLWALADTTDSTSERNVASTRADPRRRVDRWLSIATNGTAAGHNVHPFVRETAELAVRALVSVRPERYLWIDETGVISKVGSHPSDPSQPRMHNLWIPPSTGWTALDRRAQQLVADVLLLLNLAERGEPDEHERYLRRANQDGLPPCLIGDRTTMRPDLSVARPGKSNPGSSCADGCAFGLCPYPPRGTPQRQELGEAFCRRQQTLLSRPTNWFGRGSASWQRARQRDLRIFWKTMADRKRVPPSDGKAR
ncbi:MAG TPA: hypothetical protein VFH23_12880 [Jiangellaceae bacterium]|nr:hypothetical protein [Jiangellaceae bacterium]